MDRKLPDTAKSYAVDQEVDVSNDDWRYSGVNKDPIDPATFHALRVTGMALLLVTIFLSFVLVKISSRRKEEREFDIAEAKVERGGLVTRDRRRTGSHAGHWETRIVQGGSVGFHRKSVEVVKKLCTGRQR